MVPTSDVERTAATLALVAFGVPRDAVVDLVKHRENHVYRVRSAGLDRSLRMHRVDYRTDEELRSETAAIERFGREGVRVPAPATTADGQLVAVFVDDSGARRQATMQDWIADGRAFADSGEVFEGRGRPASLELSALGTLIGRMHDIASRGGANYERPAWDATGIVGPGSVWGSAQSLRTLEPRERELVAEAESRLAARFAGVPTSPDRYGLIHADFTFENVLVTDDGLVALDFDDCGMGWYMFDLATPAFWCTPHDEAADLIAAIVDGYSTVRSITAEDAELWHSMLLARGLSYLAWSADRAGDPSSDFHERVVAPWVMAATERYVETGETGWPSLSPSGAEGSR
jgi:Ser/Thr protein kinase RdoA (MazF antagonist)